MTTIMSNRQISLLKIFADGRPFLSLSEAQELDQRAFRSLWIRRYIAYKPTKGFHVTDNGLSAWDAFRFTNINRSNPTLPLFSAFDYSAYGLKPKERRMHVMAKRGAA